LFVLGIFLHSCQCKVEKSHVKQILIAPQVNCLLFIETFRRIYPERMFLNVFSSRYGFFFQHPAQTSMWFRPFHFEDSLTSPLENFPLFPIGFFLLCYFWSLSGTSNEGILNFFSSTLSLSYSHSHSLSLSPLSYSLILSDR
jgi:hypothetical protein